MIHFVRRDMFGTTALVDLAAKNARFFNLSAPLKATYVIVFFKMQITCFKL